MSAPRLVCLGCGDAFSAIWYSSCLALETEGKWLLIDCPHPIRKILREASASTGFDLDVGSFEGVVLTHLHADHCSGLEGFAYFSYFVLRRPVTLLSHPDVSNQLWDHHLCASMATVGLPPLQTENFRTANDYFDLRPLSEEQAVACGPFTIECRRTLHPIPTFALKIRAGSRMLGYSADTAFDTSLIEWLAPSDLIIHETNHNVHTPYEALAALPEPLRARMRLIHAPDDFVRDGSLIQPLVQGEVYSV